MVVSDGTPVVGLLVAPYFRGPSSLASCCQQANIGRSLFMVPLLFVAINVRDWLGRIDYIEPGRALRERLLRDPELKAV